MSLSSRDVVFFEQLSLGASWLHTPVTLRVQDLLTKLETICIQSEELSVPEAALLFGAGIECELLQPGAQDWQTGRLRLRLEFETTVSPAKGDSVQAESALEQCGSVVSFAKTSVDIADRSALELKSDGELRDFLVEDGGLAEDDLSCVEDDFSWMEDPRTLDARIACLNIDEGVLKKTFLETLNSPWPVTEPNFAEGGGFRSEQELSTHPDGLLVVHPA
jgi:hypothetical protein